MMRLSRYGRLSATVLPTSLLLLAAGLRLGGLARDQRFHPDEALYSDWSRRIGIWGDWQLSGVPVDKPPLFFLTGGFFHRLLGDSEFSTRLPNAFASLLTLALFIWIGQRLGGTAVGLMTGLLFALSPLEIAFSVSGFTDTQMMLWVALALACILRGKFGVGGLAFGLAVAVKPAALWFLPLVALIALALNFPFAQLRRWLIGFALIMLLVMGWDGVSGLGSFWQLGGQNYATGRLIRSDEVWPRAEIWLHWLADIAPHPAFLMVGFGAACVGLVGQLRHPTRRNMILWGMVGMVILYLGLHWLVAFNTFDQYLVPLVPLIALLIAWGWGQFLRSPALTIGLAALVICLGLLPAYRAGQGESAIASDQGRHKGIDTLADVMNTQYQGHVFYEHWLGWELNYYLGAEPQVFLLYFPASDDLIAHAQRELPQIPVPRYFVAPKQEAPPWLEAIQRVGLRVEIVYDDGRYLICAISV